MTLAYIISKNCIGISEVPGPTVHPMIAWAYEIAGIPGAQDDAVPWCACFQTLTAKLAGDPIPAKPARARSWLTVGQPVALAAAHEGDTVILMRGDGPQPGPDVLDAQGHVGRLVGVAGGVIRVLGGNQGNKVSVAEFPTTRVLGVRRVT